MEKEGGGGVISTSQVLLITTTTSPPFLHHLSHTFVPQLNPKTTTSTSLPHPPFAPPHGKQATMSSAALRETQAPLKAAYKSDPASALITLRSAGTLDSTSITCRLDGPNAATIASAHKRVAAEQKKEEEAYVVGGDACCAGDHGGTHGHEHNHSNTNGNGHSEENSTTPSRVAGLHPMAGGPSAEISGELCSGDMLLDALVACSGVTLKAVATALGIPLKSGTVRAEGDLDFRGTLGVDREAPVGFVAIRVLFELVFEKGREVDEEVLTKLGRLTERYCVVLQTLKGGVAVRTRVDGVVEVEDGVQSTVTWIS